MSSVVLSNTVDVRILTERDDLLRAAKLFRTAMVGLPFTDAIDGEFVDRVFEPGRTFGSFDKGALAGTVNSYSGLLAVPGDRWVTHAAVTHVGVLPTHTRRGHARRLFKAQLSASRRAGEVVATLRASDARIYGNFGYAIATTSVSYQVDATSATLREKALADGAIRLVDAEKAWPYLARIYKSAPNGRPGTISRADYWWSFQAWRHTLSQQPSYVAVYGNPGEERGYVRYHPIGLDTWFTSTTRTIVVDDIVAHTPEIYAALVAHLLAVDLPHRILFPNRPTDDVLPWLFKDYRSVQVIAARDETWLRIVDAEKALAGRGYVGSETAVLEIADEILPENNIRVRLSAEGAVATSDAADITADISTVSAAYLGGVKWWQLAQSGRIAQPSSKAVAALDALFFEPRVPYSGTMF